jgi:hypothetical protein
VFVHTFADNKNGKDHIPSGYSRWIITKDIRISGFNRNFGAIKQREHKSPSGNSRRA